MDEREVAALLSALPSPSMPRDVVDAIEQRLAQERVVVPLTPRHTRRLNWLVAAAAVLGVLALVGVGSSQQSSVTVASGLPVVRDGAVFDRSGLGPQLRDRMRTEGASATTRTFADTPAGVVACTSAVQAYGRVLFIDAGTYDREAVVVLVTSYPANSEYEEVWVVSPDCGAEQPQVYRHMLYDVDGSTLKSV